jgi:hypothetical protein
MQCFQRDAHAILISILEPEGAIEKERVTVRQDNAATPESPDANFRTLQIAHQGHIATTYFGCSTQRFGTPSVLCLIAMGKIQPRDIESGINHFAQDLLVVRRWPEGRDYFCSFSHGGDYCTGSVTSYRQMMATPSRRRD